MKKKILFFIAVVSLACMLALSVSAAVTTYDDAPVRTKIQVSADDVVVFDDGFSCPTGYVFKDQDEIYNNKGNFEAAFDFNYINGKTGKTYTFANVKDVDLPEGLKYIGSYSAASVTTLRRVTIPKTVTNINQCVFENATGLEECVFEHTEGSGLKAIPNWMFANCTSLKAISFPDCVEKFTGMHQLGGCTNLTAVYLPKNLISTASGRDKNGTFGHCYNMYFVNTPFTYDNIPVKPDVYYFPSSYNFAEQEAFGDCYNLNKVLVFTADNMSLNDAYMFEKVQSGEGSKPIIVFTGNVSAVKFGSWNVEAVYFANENDVDATSAGVTGSGKMYFCYAPDNKNHLAEKTIATEAGCESAGYVKTLCFCGAEISSEETAPLGHDYENGETVIVFGATLYDNVSQCIACARGCGANGEETDLGVVIMEKGYSTCDIGGIRSFTRGYFVNNELLNAYEAEKGVSVEIGFAFNLADGFDMDNYTLDSFKAVMVLKEPNEEFEARELDYMVRYKNDSYLDTLVVIAGYVSENGAVTFGGELESVSYNSLAKAGNVTVTPDENGGTVDGSVDIDSLLGLN